MSDERSGDPEHAAPRSDDRDAFYLTHMLESIEAIERYCASSEIESDDRTLDAVLRKLQIMTESSKRVSAAIKEAHPSVNWRELAGFRNVVVHDYLGIGVERIGMIVREDLPRLKSQLLAIIASLHR